MSVLKATPNPIYWWNQFPSALRIVTKVRLLASIGAGGVIYLTPLIFNQIQLSATQIGSGIALAALAGTFARLISGSLLDRGTTYSWPVRYAAVIAIIADIFLLKAHSYDSFLKGQLLVGIATGLYWPAIELAVSTGCENYSSSKGFALARSADALGISFGTTLGSIVTSLGAIRFIYLIDIICMGSLLILLAKKPLKTIQNEDNDQLNTNESKFKNGKSNYQLNWFTKLLPLLVLSLLATGILSLLQSALPIDLVKGGILRPPLNEGWSSGLIAIQLGLLVFLQWPIGRFIASKNIKFGLIMSFTNFGIGCFLLSWSSFSEKGVFIALVAMIPLSIALASFLPTATNAVIKTTPFEKRGIAMALFSQTFAISAFAAPLFAGSIIDNQGNALLIWILVGGSAIAMIPIINGINIINQK